MVLFKHQKGPALVIVGVLFSCDNEAIKQKQTQTQNQKPKTKQTSGGKNNEKIYQEGRFKEGFQSRRTYLRNRNHLHPRRRTALQLHRSLQELHGSTRRNLIPKDRSINNQTARDIRSRAYCCNWRLRAERRFFFGPAFLDLLEDGTRYEHAR